jgi:hypothetical protein
MLFLPGPEERESNIRNLKYQRPFRVGDSRVCSRCLSPEDDYPVTGLAEHFHF